MRKHWRKADRRGGRGQPCSNQTERKLLASAWIEIGYSWSSCQGVGDVIRMWGSSSERTYRLERRAQRRIDRRIAFPIPPRETAKSVTVGQRQGSKKIKPGASRPSAGGGAEGSSPRIFTEDL